MTAHIAGLPIEEMLPAAIAAGAVLVAALRSRLVRRPAKTTSYPDS